MHTFFCLCRDVMSSMTIQTVKTKAQFSRLKPFTTFAEHNGLIIVLYELLDYSHELQFRVITGYNCVLK